MFQLFCANQSSNSSSASFLDSTSLTLLRSSLLEIMADHPIPLRRISDEEMRTKFNSGNYWQKAKEGELKPVVIEDRHPSLPLACVPFCTYSQMVSYRDGDDNEIARVHQYL